MRIRLAINANLMDWSNDKQITWGTIKIFSANKIKPVRCLSELFVRRNVGLTEEIYTEVDLESQGLKAIKL